MKLLNLNEAIQIIMNEDGDKRLRVLIVDSLEIYRAAFSKLLDKYGYNVATADCGFKAIEVMTIFRPSVVVITGTLPGMNGIQCCKSLLKIDPEVKIIFTSSDSSTELKNRAEMAGAIEFLEKPFDGTALKNAVEKCISIDIAEF